MVPLVELLENVESALEVAVPIGSIVELVNERINHGDGLEDVSLDLKKNELAISLRRRVACTRSFCRCTHSEACSPEAAY